MKGQHLAVESVLTLGLGLVIATGSITLFSDYRANVLESGERGEARMIIMKIQNSVKNLEMADSGVERLDLPEKIGGEKYQIVLDNRIEVFSQNEIYVKNISSSGLSLKGTSDGGSIKLFKRSKKIRLRDSS